MEVEKPAEEFSKEELRRQLYSSLRSTGVLDSMKGQLRARLLEHLRHHNGDSMKVKRKQGKPSLTARLLSSLFLDYLQYNEFTFTISVFMPESQMASWRPFAYEEMLELLHLDPSSDMHIRLKLGKEGKECLAHQLVTVLQQMAHRNCISEVSTQTSPAVEPCKNATQTSCTSPRDLERSMTEVEDAYGRKKGAHEVQRLVPYGSLEEKITILHQEFDARVNAEVALQVSRVRDYEVNTARMDEAARYRRQLARDREELEDIHKARMDRIKAREESLLERMLSKEKAIEVSAYEQRQKILSEITCLRERENMLRQFKDSQERREEKLDERELSLRAKEEEVAVVRKTLYAQADEIIALRKKELEQQYKELCDRLDHERTLLEAEREQMKEEKVAIAIELAASRSDKELIQALHHRLRVEEDQRLNLAKTTRELEVKLEVISKQQLKPPLVPVDNVDLRSEDRLRELQNELAQERIQRQAIEKESKTFERKLQQKKVELAAARAPQRDWITEHKNLMATIHQQDVELQKKEMKLELLESEKEKLTTRLKKLLLKIDHLDTLVKEAQDEKDRAIHDLVKLQDQHKITEGELLETVTLLRKAKQALETERLDQSAVQYHKKTLASAISSSPQRVCVSQDKHEQNSSLFEPRPSADEIIRKKWETFRKKPRRESHDLWTHVLSDSAAKKLSHNQDIARISANHFPTSSIPNPFSSGLDYQLLEMRDNGSLRDLDVKPSWKTNVEVKSSNPTDWKAITVEEYSSVKGGITKTEALITGSVEEIYASSWNGERNCEDPILSWKKALLPRPGSWNISHEEVENKSVVTCRRSEFGNAIHEDSKDAWNVGRYGDACHADRAQTIENHDDQEPLGRLRCMVRTAGIHSENVIQIHNPADTSTQILKSTQDEMKPLEAHDKGSITPIISAISYNETEELAKTQVVLKPDSPSNIAKPEIVLEHDLPLRTESGSSDLQLAQSMREVGGHDSEPSPAIHHVEIKGNDTHETEGSKEKECAISNDGHEERVIESNTQTRETNENDTRTPGDPEEHTTHTEPNEISKPSLEPPESHEISKLSLEPPQSHEILVVNDTKEDDGDKSWTLYAGEEESSSEDSTPSCRCLASLRREQESMEESRQSELLTSASSEPHSEEDETIIEVPQKAKPDNLAVEDIEHESRSDAVEDKTDETKETNAADEAPSDPTGAHEPVEVSNEVNQVAMDLTSLVPIPTQSDLTSLIPIPTQSDESLSASEGNSEKDLNKLLKCLGLSNDEETLSQKTVDDDAVPTSGNLSGLPEMGEMLYKREMSLLQEASPVKGTTPRASPSQDRLETLRTSIIMKRHETENKESPRLAEWMSGHRTHPTLALAIRNNQLVKLESPNATPRSSTTSIKATQETLTPRSSTTNIKPTQETLTPRSSIVTKPTQETPTPRSSIVPKPTQETPTPRSSTNTKNTQETPRQRPAILPTTAPCGETHSSSEELIYQGDSFEEEEEEDDEGRDSTAQAPGLFGLETIERSSPKIGGNGIGRSSVSWEGESDQGSYSPDEESIPDLPDTCRSQGSTTTPAIQRLP